jgi:GT2 family glycosyltransferase
MNYNSNHFSETIKIFNGNHQWFTRTVNRGLKLTKEKFILMINSDCVFQSGWLDELFNVMELTDAGLVGSNSIRNDIRYKIIKPGEHITGHCWLYNREKTINVIGYLDESKNSTVHYGSDSDYCYKLTNKHITVVESYFSKVIHIGNHPSTNLIDPNNQRVNELSKADFLAGKLD